MLERKIVFYPKNSTFGPFMETVSSRLGLQGAEGVETVDALAESMIQRQVFVCIEFKHNAVSVCVRGSFHLFCPK